jgi:hypothetical protein
VATAAALVAAGAALYTYRAGRAAALLVQAPKELRGAPFRVSVLDALIRTGPPDTPWHCAFLLSVLNDSGSTCTFTKLALRVHYRTPANFCCSLDVPMPASIDAGGMRTGEVTLRLPLVLEGGRTLAGWAQFETTNAVPADCTVDAYAVVLQGSGGESFVTPVPFVTLVERSAVGGDRAEMR